MKRLILPVLLLLGAFYHDAKAQQKFEKESRLDPAEVPAEAIQFVQAVEKDTRWKWYSEENLIGNSVEAKTKYNGKWYSVEFDTSGKIQDVEIEKDFSEVDEKVSSTILKALDSMFSTHKIDKIQIQYSAESPVLLAILNSKADRSTSRIQYEMVVKGKKEGRPKLYELTFDDKGNLLESAEIIFRNTDNLEF